MRDSKKNIIKHIAGYLIGISVFVILIPAGIWYMSSLDYHILKTPIISNEFIRQIISLLIFITGTIFVIWSNVFLLIKGKGGPTNIAGISISPKTKVIVVDGPYRYTRNPMIFGTNAIYISISIYLNSLGSLAAVIILFFMLIKYVVPNEEKRLVNDFGNEYIKYKKCTPMIFPSFTGRSKKG